MKAIRNHAHSMHAGQEMIEPSMEPWGFHRGLESVRDAGLSCTRRAVEQDDVSLAH